MRAPNADWIGAREGTNYALDAAGYRGAPINKQGFFINSLLAALQRGEIRARYRRHLENREAEETSDWSMLDEHYWEGHQRPTSNPLPFDADIEFHFGDLQRWLSPASTPKVGAKRGPKPKWDWDEFWIEVVAVANAPDGIEHGNRGNQSAFVDRMRGWFLDKYDVSPSKSQIEERAKRLFERLTR